MCFFSASSFLTSSCSVCDFSGAAVWRSRIFCHMSVLQILRMSRPSFADLDMAAARTLTFPEMSLLTGPKATPPSTSVPCCQLYIGGYQVRMSAPNRPSKLSEAWRNSVVLIALSLLASMGTWMKLLGSLSKNVSAIAAAILQ